LTLEHKSRHTDGKVVIIILFQLVTQKINTPPDVASRFLATQNRVGAEQPTRQSRQNRQMAAPFNITDKIIDFYHFSSAKSAPIDIKGEIYEKAPFSALFSRNPTRQSRQSRQNRHLLISLVN